MGLEDVKSKPAPTYTPPPPELQKPPEPVKVPAPVPAETIVVESAAKDQIAAPQKPLPIAPELKPVDLTLPITAETFALVNQIKAQAGPLTRSQAQKLAARIERIPDNQAAAFVRALADEPKPMSTAMLGRALAPHINDARFDATFAKVSPGDVAELRTLARSDAELPPPKLAPPAQVPDQGRVDALLADYEKNIADPTANAATGEKLIGVIAGYERLLTTLPKDSGEWLAVREKLVGIKTKVEDVEIHAQREALGKQNPDVAKIFAEAQNPKSKLGQAMAKMGVTERELERYVITGAATGKLAGVGAELRTRGTHRSGRVFAAMIKLSAHAEAARATMLAEKGKLAREAAGKATKAEDKTALAKNADDLERASELFKTQAAAKLKAADRIPVEARGTRIVFARRIAAYAQRRLDSDKASPASKERAQKQLTAALASLDEEARQAKKLADAYIAKGKNVPKVLKSAATEASNGAADVQLYRAERTTNPDEQLALVSDAPTEAGKPAGAGFYLTLGEGVDAKLKDSDSQLALRQRQFAIGRAAGQQKLFATGYSPTLPLAPGQEAAKKLVDDYTFGLEGTLSQRILARKAEDPSRADLVRQRAQLGAERLARVGAPAVLEKQLKDGEKLSADMAAGIAEMQKQSAEAAKWPPLAGAGFVKQLADAVEAKKKVDENNAATKAQLGRAKDDVAALRVAAKARGLDSVVNHPESLVARTDNDYKEVGAALKQAQTKKPPPSKELVAGFLYEVGQYEAQVGGLQLGGDAKKRIEASKVAILAGDKQLAGLTALSDPNVLRLSMTARAQLAPLLSQNGEPKVAFAILQTGSSQLKLFAAAVDDKERAQLRGYIVDAAVTSVDGFEGNLKKGAVEVDAVDSLSALARSEAKELPKDQQTRYTDTFARWDRDADSVVILFSETDTQVDRELEAGKKMAAMGKEELNALVDQETSWVANVVLAPYTYATEGESARGFAKKVEGRDVDFSFGDVTTEAAQTKASAMVFRDIFAQAKKSGRTREAVAAFREIGSSPEATQRARKLFAELYTAAHPELPADKAMLIAQKVKIPTHASIAGYRAGAGTNAGFYADQSKYSTGGLMQSSKQFGDYLEKKIAKRKDEVKVVKWVNIGGELILGAVLMRGANIPGMLAKVPAFVRVGQAANTFRVVAGASRAINVVRVATPTLFRFGVGAAEMGATIYAQQKFGQAARYVFGKDSFIADTLTGVSGMFALNVGSHVAGTAGAKIAGSGLGKQAWAEFLQTRGPAILLMGTQQGIERGVEHFFPKQAHTINTLIQIFLPAGVGAFNARRQSRGQVEALHKEMLAEMPADVSTKARGLLAKAYMQTEGLKPELIKPHLEKLNADLQKAGVKGPVAEAIVNERAMTWAKAHTAAPEAKKGERPTPEAIDAYWKGYEKKLGEAGVRDPAAVVEKARAFELMQDLQIAREALKDQPEKLKELDKKIAEIMEPKIEVSAQSVSQRVTERVDVALKRGANEVAARDTPAPGATLPPKPVASGNVAVNEAKPAQTPPPEGKTIAYAKELDYQGKKLTVAGIDPSGRLLVAERIPGGFQWHTLDLTTAVRENPKWLDHLSLKLPEKAGEPPVSGWKITGEKNGEVTLTRFDANGTARVRTVKSETLLKALAGPLGMQAIPGIPAKPIEGVAKTTIEPLRTPADYQKALDAQQKKADTAVKKEALAAIENAPASVRPRMLENLIAAEKMKVPTEVSLGFLRAGADGVQSYGQALAARAEHLALPEANPLHQAAQAEVKAIGRAFAEGSVIGKRYAAELAAPNADKAFLMKLTELPMSTFRSTFDAYVRLPDGAGRTFLKGEIEARSTDLNSTDLSKRQNATMEVRELERAYQKLQSPEQARGYIDLLRTAKGPDRALLVRIIDTLPKTQAVTALFVFKSAPALRPAIAKALTGVSQAAAFLTLGKLSRQQKLPAGERIDGKVSDAISLAASSARLSGTPSAAMMTPHIAERGMVALRELPAAEYAQVKKMIDGAGSPHEVAYIMKGLAARGAQLHTTQADAPVRTRALAELGEYAAAIKGKSQNEIAEMSSLRGTRLTTINGEVVVAGGGTQKMGTSCGPTTALVARAEIDPVSGWRYRDTAKGKDGLTGPERFLRDQVALMAAEGSAYGFKQAGVAEAKAQVQINISAARIVMVAREAHSNRKLTTVEVEALEGWQGHRGRTREQNGTVERMETSQALKDAYKKLEPELRKKGVESFDEFCTYLAKTTWAHPITLGKSQKVQEVGTWPEHYLDKVVGGLVGVKFERRDVTASAPVDPNNVSRMVQLYGPVPIVVTWKTAPGQPAGAHAMLVTEVLAPDAAHGYRRFRVFDPETGMEAYVGDRALVGDKVVANMPGLSEGHISIVYEPSARPNAQGTIAELPQAPSKTLYDIQAINDAKARARAKTETDLPAVKVPPERTKTLEMTPVKPPPVNPTPSRTKTLEMTPVTLKDSKPGAAPQPFNAAERAHTGPEPVLRPATHEVDLAGATTRLAALKPGDQLSSADAAVLLNESIGTAREAIVGERRRLALSRGEATPSTETALGLEVGGYCGFGTAVIYHRLVALGIKPQNITLHQAFDAFPGGRDPSRHAFAVVKMPDGKSYLVDTTFRQFFDPRRTDAGKIGVAGDVMRKEGNGAIADRIIGHGMVELTDAVANAYGRALAGGDVPGQPPLKFTAKQLTEKSTAQLDFDFAHEVLPRVERSVSLEINRFTSVDNVPAHYVTDRARFIELSKDPAHNGAIGEKSTREVMSGLEAERLGWARGPIKRGPKEVDFIDADRTPFDVKTPLSPELAGGPFKFKPEWAADSILAQLRKTHTGEDGVTRPVRVILDVSYLKEAHRYQIWEQLRAKGATEAELARIYEINVRP